MHKVVLRLKSGKEFKFSCDEYTFARQNLTGELTEFSYSGGVGECPLFFRIEDVESISVISNVVTMKGNKNEQ